MNCKCTCKTDEEKEKIINEFLDDLTIVTDKYEEIMPKMAMAACLIKLATRLVCSDGEGYYTTVGILNSILNAGLEEMWEQANEEEEEEKQKESE